MAGRRAAASKNYAPPTREPALRAFFGLELLHELDVAAHRILARRSLALDPGVELRAVDHVEGAGTLTRDVADACLLVQRVQREQRVVVRRLAQRLRCGGRGVELGIERN